MQEEIGLGPQCGFARLDLGNLVSVEEQNRKLCHPVDIARDIWGDG